jgi:uncharacterized membrane protein
MTTFGVKSVFQRAIDHAGGPSLRLGALMMASGWALLWWTLRAAYFGPHLMMLWWNLILAWIPWWASAALQHQRHAERFWALSALWLVFFPNAPYLLTDLVHLTHPTTTPI